MILHILQGVEASAKRGLKHVSFLHWNSVSIPIDRLVIDVHDYA
jgi:hypothetical protein